MKKIVIVGLGYVGASLAVLLAKKNSVWAIDVDQRKLDSINKRESPLDDRDLQHSLQVDELNLHATKDYRTACMNASYAIIAVPTSYDPISNCFDTSLVEKVMENIIRENPTISIIIKSTIPVGYTKSLRKAFKYEKIYFSPEFLREGNALHDNLYPSRIIIGSSSAEAIEFGKLLLAASKRPDTPLLFLESEEAEAIKLFSNTYLAMRVAFFNELDSYAIANKLDAKQIINGVGLDPRIGGGYNNPSFGYGGYCLPKDTKQLLANYKDIPQSLIQAIVAANSTRKDFIADEILKKEVQVLGIYRLVMKEGSDNYRDSSVQGIMKRLKAKGKTLIVYEPGIESSEFFGSQVITDLDEFISKSDLIVANRMSEELRQCEYKVFTRDLFGKDI